MPGPEVAVIAFLPAKDAPTTAPMPGDLVLALDHHAAVLPDLAAEELHDLGRGRDRVAAEEVAAGEDRRRRAHLVAVDDHLAGRGEPLGRGERRAARAAGAPPPTARRRRTRSRCPAGSRRPSCANFLRRPDSSASRPTPSQPASSPSTTEFLARSVPAVFFAISAIGTAIASRGVTPGERQAVRGHVRGRVVDDRRVAADRELGAELQEVLPVQRDGHVERSAGAAHRLRREPHTAGRLAAADLRAEALGQDGVVAAEGRRGHHRLAGGDDAVAARPGHPDHEVVAHGSPWCAPRALAVRQRRAVRP